MMDKINLLDHGYIRLVDSMGNDLSVVRAARVSYDADWRTGEDEGKDEKLISYMMKNKHTSPFESVSFTFEVCAPIFVFRQWQRHRTWKYNEISARYTELPEQYYLPTLEQLTTQSTSNKQMRTEEQNENAGAAQDTIDIVCSNAFAAYKEMLADGIPRELARGVLPMNTYSRMFATVDLHNLFHFLKLRLHAHAQYEIRVYAEAILKLIESIVPISLHYFHKYQLEI